MPRGVADHFLRILQLERKASLRGAITMLLLTPLAYFMAELTDVPLFGTVVITALIVFLVALILGAVWMWLITRKFNDSILDNWNAWQRASLSATRISEVARRVAEKGPRPPLAGVGWAILLIANVVLFAALWIEYPSTYELGFLVSVVNALVLGLIAGRRFWMARWTRTFRNALDELIAEGRVGFWGEA